MKKILNLLKAISITLTLLLIIAILGLLYEMNPLYIVILALLITCMIYIMLDN